MALILNVVQNEVMGFLTAFIFIVSTAVAEDFSVSSIKTVKVVPPKDIQLMYPPHRCVMSTGIVTFKWEFKKKLKKKKLSLVVEDIDNKQTKRLNAKNTKKSHWMDPGLYRWKVLDEKNNIDSRWRVVKIVADGRSVSSVGKNNSKIVEKTSMALPDYDDDGNALPSILDHSTAPSLPQR